MIFWLYMMSDGATASDPGLPSAGYLENYQIFPLGTKQQRLI